eukprot:gene446-480_t
MSFPIRVSIATYNVWGRKYWPQRAESLTQTLLSLRPDILLLQEVTPAIIQFLDQNLSSYSRVQSTNRPGWTKESNIYWNSSMFDLVDEGVGNLEMADYPDRGLFWVRLALRSDPSKTLFVSTAHFPWVGCEAEIESGVNQRILAATKVCQHLRRLIPGNEFAVFGGDFNDDFHPVRILSEECALLDVFEALDLPPPITHPVRPSDVVEEMRPNRTLDWILCNLPSHCRVVAAFAKTVRGGRFPPPSDHLPVMAIFEI